MSRLVDLLIRALVFARNGWNGHLVPFVASLLSVFRSPNQLVEMWPTSEPELGSKVAIFVHFDRQGIARDYVLHYLAALQAAGYEIAFVSNSGQLQPAAVEALRLLCSVIIVRRNVGYDFGAMREAVLRLRLPRRNTAQLLIVNDSVYGPLCPLDDLLNAIDFDEADFWGATESWQGRYHLQSYFMAFGPKAMQHRAWEAFWRGVRPVASKAYVIKQYEVGLTQRLLRGGLRPRAVWKYPDLVRQINPDLMIQGGEEGPVSTDPIHAMRKAHARRIRDAAVTRQPLNPTSDLWRQLLHAGFPFLKRELLRENPTYVADVTDWREVVIELLGADPGIIDRDLQRVARNVAP
jgi:hypothetical protein